MGWTVGFGSQVGSPIYVLPSVAPVAGSKSIGTTAYDIPAGSIFADNTGAGGGAGSEVSPYHSAAAALAAASSGQTIVMRGGNYNEALNVPAGKNIRFQAYPNEPVWFDSNSTKARFVLASSRVEMYGIGVREYTGGGTSDSQGAYAMGFLGGTVGGSIFENCVFDSAGLDGFKIATKNATLRWVTFRNAQRTGLQATQCDGILIDQCLSYHNNRGGYAAEPETAGIKITRCDGGTIRCSWIEDIPGAYGAWFDVWCTRNNLVANVIKAGASTLNHCIELELSDGGNFLGTQYYNYVVGNLLQNAAYAGVKLLDTGYTVIGNNDMRSCSLGMWMQQDNREHGSSDYRTPTECPAHCLANPLLNNIYNGSTGFTAYDAAGVFNYKGGQMVGRVSGNWSSGSQMGSLGAVGGSRVTYVNPSDLASVDAAHGGPLNLGTNYRGSTAPASTIAEPMSPEVATLLGLSTGTQLVGPNTALLPTLREAA